MRLESSPQRFFYVNSKQFKSNSNQSEKQLENTEVFKKESDNRQSTRRLYKLEKQSSRSVLQNICPEKFNNIANQENNHDSILFFISLPKRFPQGCFLRNFLEYFWNRYFKKYLRMAASEIVQDSHWQFSFLQKQPFTRAVIKIFNKFAYWVFVK